MRYGSLCSGIEAATKAWHQLGWEPAFFSEIEAFPSAVLNFHYPHVPNHGDMTKFESWPDHAIDLLVGGTPCQSFSVAGLRKGLDDPRGNLMLVFGAVAQRYRPRWLAWENVPGVLSDDGGRSFASLLGLLSGRRIEVPRDGWGNAGIVPGYEGAYGLAWRVLDAQYVRVDGFGRAVPQRRRRVFVVGYLGDWRRAAAVLLEPEGMCGNPAPRRETGKNVAPTISARTQGGGGLGIDFDLDGGPIDVAAGLNAKSTQRQDFDTETFVVNSISPAITQNPYGDNESRDGLLVAHTLRGEGFDASEDGTGRQNLIPIAFDRKATNVSSLVDLAPTLRSIHAAESHANGGGQLAVAFDMRGREGGAQFEGPHETANIRAASGGSSRSYVAQQWAVRRLTPRECERLQGFPDDFTNIPWRKRNDSPDGPRYKALGNSMAVNVMRWIGRRISIVDAIEASEVAA